MVNPENTSPEPSETPALPNSANPPSESSENLPSENLETPPPTSPENPFLEIKARNIVWWIPIGILGLGCLLLILSIPWAIFVLFGDPDAGAVSLAHPDPIFFLVISNLWLYSLMAFWCFLQIRRSRLIFPQLLGKRPNRRRELSQLLLVVPILMFSLGSGQLLLSILARIFPDLAASLLEDNLLSGASDTAIPWVYNAFLILLLVVIAPVVEETLFRGIILQRWATKWGLTAGIISSSLLFGILHLNVVGLSIFGIAMAVLYLKTKTLWLPIAVHALNNAAVVLVSFLPGQINGSPQNLSLEQLSSSWRVGMLYTMLSFPLLVLYFYRNWPGKKRLFPYWANAEKVVEFSDKSATDEPNAIEKQGLQESENNEI
ncbi:MAG: type II CAAX endopeptidase family protein [Cyanobacteriota bacterium]|nr:type II CAAX endopeptidase family protein [Cyanobacteriota bacterium]